MTAETLEAAIAASTTGLSVFVDEMRGRGIHVGVGGVPLCAIDGEPWPCATETAARAANAARQG